MPRDVENVFFFRPSHRIDSGAGWTCKSWLAFLYRPFLLTYFRDAIVSEHLFFLYSYFTFTNKRREDTTKTDIALALGWRVNQSIGKHWKALESIKERKKEMNDFLAYIALGERCKVFILDNYIQPTASL
jgi:hypothetical protein